MKFYNGEKWLELDSFLKPSGLKYKGNSMTAPVSYTIVDSEEECVDDNVVYFVKYPGRKIIFTITDYSSISTASNIEYTFTFSNGQTFNYYFENMTKSKTREKYLLLDDDIDFSSITITIEETTGTANVAYCKLYAYDCAGSQIGSVNTSVTLNSTTTIAMTDFSGVWVSGSAYSYNNFSELLNDKDYPGHYFKFDIYYEPSGGTN